MLTGLLEERFKTFSAAFLVMLLGLSGLTIMLWMAGAGWEDIHGIVLGVLFIALSIGQSLFVVIWYRAVKHKKSKQQDRETTKEMVDMSHSTVKEAEMSKGARESAAPLLSNRESANVVVEVADVQVEEKLPAHLEAAAQTAGDSAVKGRD